jgi:hypothetical protein
MNFSYHKMYLFLVMCFLVSLNSSSENIVIVDAQSIDTLDIHSFYNKDKQRFDSIAPDRYACHSLYLINKDAQQNYIFVYGTQLYDSLAGAQQNPEPLVLDHNEATLLLAHLLVSHDDIYVRHKATRSQVGTFNLGALTPSLPLILDADLNVISNLVNLADHTTGTLPVTLGGTSSNSLGTNALLASNSAGTAIIALPNLTTGQILIGSTGGAPIASTFALPATAPTNGQVLQATSPTVTEWAAISDPFIVYVTTTGNDITGNGSSNAPYRTLKQALVITNAIASVSTPVKISVGPGIFIEDTSSGPLTVNPINSGGLINIVGTSSRTTMFMSLTPTQTFLYLPTTTRLEEFTIMGITGAPAIGGDGAYNGSAFINVVAWQCQQGFNLSGGVNTTYFLDGISCCACGVGATLNNAQALMYNCSFDGTLPGADIPANTGVVVTGASSRVVSESCAYLYCDLCFEVSQQGNTTFIGGSFLNSVTAVQAMSQATCIVNGATFYANSGTNMIAQDLGTSLQSTGCNINGISLSGLKQGTGLLITGSAQANFAVGSLTNLVNGIIIGTPTDDNVTQLLSVGVTINNCSQSQIIQNGFSQLTFTDGALNRSFVTIANPTNIVFNTIDASNNQAIVIGQHADVDQDLMLVDIGTALLPGLNYRTNYNDYKGILYQNPNGEQASLLGVQSQDSNAQLSAITGANNATASVQLCSNGGLFGGSTNLRGWTLQKTATDALLAGQFYNSDISGKPAVDAYTSFQFDGFNNILQFPAVTTTHLPTNTVTMLQWAGDTNLYRASTGLLQTDNNFAIQGLLSANSALYVDNNKQIAASSASATDLAQLAGITGGPIQTQITTKVSKNGDVMTGNLTLPVGVLADPALNFFGFSKTGLCMTGNVFNLVTSGSSRLTVDSNGLIGINASSVSNSLTVTGGVSITGNMVVTGTLTTNGLTIINTPVNPTDGATKAYVDSTAQGLQVKLPCTVLAANTIGALFGTATIDDIALVAGSRALLISQTNAIQNGIWTIQNGAWTRPADFSTGSSAQAAYTFIQSGTTYGDSGYFCTALNPQAVIDTNNLTFVQFSNIQDVNGLNVGSGAAIFAGKVGSVLQLKSLDAGANMSITSNGTDITIDLPPALNLSGKITSGGSIIGTSLSDGTGLLKNGTFNLINIITTGTITVAPGTVAYPSINFTSSPYTGLSAQSPDTLVISTAGSNRLQINSSGTIRIPAFTPAGIIHNDSLGNLTSSLVANADIASNAAIVDTKLGTLQTSGKVANSATTGTNLNSANTLVVRDNSGNFNAGVVSASLQAPAGTVLSPSITFTNSINAGLSSPITGQLSLSAGGSECLQFQAGGNIYVPSFVSSNGMVKSTLGILSSALIADADIIVGAGIQDSKLATISSVGKIANSATTATSANTNNTIVLRDASGNLAANQVTITNLILGNQAGVLLANSGIVTATSGTTGQRLATFGSPATTGFYRPVEPSRESYLFDDFNGAVTPFADTSGWNIVAAGTGAAVSAVGAAQGTFGDFGVIQLSSGTTAAGALLYQKQINGMYFGLGNFYYEWRISVPTLSVTGQLFSVNLGFGNASTAAGLPTNGIYFTIPLANPGTALSVVTTKAGVSTTTPTTQTLAANTYYRLGLLVNAAANSVIAYVNDIAVTPSITTNIPNTTSNTCGPFVQIIKSTGTTARTVAVDYCFYQYEFSAQR